MPPSTVLDVPTQISEMLLSRTAASESLLSDMRNATRQTYSAELTSRYYWWATPSSQAANDAIVAAINAD